MCGVSFREDGIDEDGHYDETKDRTLLKRMKNELSPEKYKEFLKALGYNFEGINYENLSDEHKGILKDMALNLGYRIEGTTDKEVKEYFTRRLKEDDELRKKQK